MLPYVTIGKFSNESGYTAGAIEAKVKRRDWVEGEEYIRAPDGRILVCVEGFEKWVRKQNIKTSDTRLTVASKSPSITQRKRQKIGNVNELNCSPLPLI